MRPSLTFRYAKIKKPSWINLFLKYNINYIILQFSKKQQIQLLKIDLNNIKFILFPTKEIQLKIIKKYPIYIGLIRFQHKEAKELAFNIDPNLIEYIHWPSYEMKMKAVQYDPYNLFLIGQIDYDLCAEAIRQAPTMLYRDYKKLIKRKLSRKDYKKIKELYEFLII
jgi:hypothetical protein